MRSRLLGRGSQHLAGHPGSAPPGLPPEALGPLDFQAELRQLVGILIHCFKIGDDDPSARFEHANRFSDRSGAPFGFRYVVNGHARGDEVEGAVFEGKLGHVARDEIDARIDSVGFRVGGGRLFSVAGLVGFAPQVYAGQLRLGEALSRHDDHCSASAAQVEDSFDVGVVGLAQDPAPNGELPTKRGVQVDCRSPKELDRQQSVDDWLPRAAAKRPECRGREHDSGYEPQDRHVGGVDPIRSTRFHFHRLPWSISGLQQL